MSSTRAQRPFFPVLVLVLGMVPAVQAQSTGQPSPNQAWVLERHVKDRWVHEGQHPGFVRFEDWTDPIHLNVRASGTRPPTKTLTIRVSGLEASIDLDGLNHVFSRHIQPRGPTITASLGRQDRASLRWAQFQGRGATLNLPEARVWNIPFRVPPGELAQGDSWTDSLSLMADPGDGFFQSLKGVQRNEVLGDTIINGRRWPLVRILAEVDYRSEGPIRDWAMEGPLVINRTASGTITGWAAVDTILGVRAAGRDSLRWEGTATLLTQEGQSFTSPVRYEAVRDWTLTDSLGWVHRRDSIRAHRGDNSRGLLILPGGPLDDRLFKGDRLFADSLMEAWAATEDRMELDRIRGILAHWGRDSGLSMEELEAKQMELRFEFGDSAGVVHDLLGPGSSTLTTKRLSVLVPYLDDLDKLWCLGIAPAHAFRQLGEEVLTASPLLEPDSSRWRCAPDACRQVIALLDSARERRLRDVALVAAFVRDPLPWHDSIVARTHAGSLVTGLAYELSKGVPGGGNYGLHLPIPESGAPWREWRDWLRGPGGRGGQPVGDLRQLRHDGWIGAVQDHHRHALRLYTSVTGSDPLEELQGAWPPEGDSAKLVLGTILRETGHLQPFDLEGLKKDALSGSPALVAAATGELARRFDKTGPSVDEGVVRELLPGLIEWQLFRGERPWPALQDHLQGQFEPGIPSEVPDPGGSAGPATLVLDQDFPSWLQEIVDGKAILIEPDTLAERSPRGRGRLLRIYPIKGEGPFAVVTWGWTSSRERDPGQAPSGDVSGGTAYLLRTDQGWVQVSSNGWIIA